MWPSHRSSNHVISGDTDAASDDTDLELVEKIVGIEIRAIVESDGYFTGVDTVVNAGTTDEHIAKFRPWYRGSVQS